MNHDLQAPSDLGWDMAEPCGNWGSGSSAVLLAVAGSYWIATWLVAGLPPLTALASRGLGRRRPARTSPSRLTQEAPNKTG